MDNPPNLWVKGVFIEPTKENVKDSLVHFAHVFFEVTTANEELLVERIMEVREGWRHHMDMIYAFDKQGRFVRLDRVPDEVYKAVPCPFWETQDGRPVRCGGPEHDVRNWRAIGERASR